MSEHNDEEKQNVPVLDNKAVGKSARIRTVIEIILFFLMVYANIEMFSGHYNIFVKIIISVNFLYYTAKLFAYIGKWLKKKTSGTREV